MVEPGTVLHLAPHPDDELIGAPATLFALRDAGWRVVNLACSLGAPDQRHRRRAELEDACARAGYLLDVVAEPATDPLGPAQLPAVETMLRQEIGAALDRHRPAVVVSPSPHDRHRGHEVVGRAALGALGALGDSDVAGAAAAPATRADVPRLWLWGLWGDLPFPTLATAFGAERLEEILGALAAHAGELERNDYRRLVRGRAEMNASLGPERVFGFGGAAPSRPYVELLCEVVCGSDGRWALGSRRWLDPGDPLDGGARGGDADVTEWLRSDSLTTRYGLPSD
jgi:LmbE family N-acetylglucosaminyl deacetylase